MQRIDLHLAVVDPAGNVLAIETEPDNTSIGVLERGSGTATFVDKLTDADLRALRDHINLILETEQ